MTNTKEILVADTPEKIKAWRLLTLRSALRLECYGMGRRGQSAYSIIKSEFGFRGSKASVLGEFTAYLKDEGILVSKN